MPTQHEVADSSKRPQVGDVSILFDFTQPDFVALESIDLEEGGDLEVPPNVFRNVSGNVGIFVGANGSKVRRFSY